MALSAKLTSASISATTTSARTAYLPTMGVYLRVHNQGTQAVFIRSGDVSVVATVTDQFIPASGTIVMIRDMVDTNLAAITATGTSTVYFVPTESTMTISG